MDDRLVEFVRGLRAAGVRVSVAEAGDAAGAIGAVGLQDQAVFRRALRATLVKDNEGFAAFDALFPLYFGSGGPPLENALEQLAPDDQDLVRAALAALAGRAQQLLDWLTSGEGPSKEALEELARRLGAQRAKSPGEAMYITRRMLKELGFERLPELLARLAEALAQAGLSPEAIEALMGVMQANRDALAERIAQQVGLDAARRRAEQAPPGGGNELLHRPFADLTPQEAEALRKEVTRLVARLRSRAALRQKRARAGRLDPRRTIRANQRYGGVPLELKHRRRRLKPCLVLICDVSTSMRPVAEFMLRLIYELADQVARARSFAFNDDLMEISPLLAGGRAAEAVSDVLWAIPPGYYATDLGTSLETFFERHLDAVDGRTTVIVLGDGRNNHRDPRADLLSALGRRAKRLIWLNPEPPQRWGTDDSDMLAYAPRCHAVYTVADLAQLSAAVDRLLAG
jgi:uncharacterized protein with von Willebrand factor type A (vWA) domain